MPDIVDLLAFKDHFLRAKILNVNDFSYWTWIFDLYGSDFDEEKSRSHHGLPRSL